MYYIHIDGLKFKILHESAVKDGKTQKYYYIMESFDKQSIIDTYKRGYLENWYLLKGFITPIEAKIFILEIKKHALIRRSKFSCTKDKRSVFCEIKKIENIQSKLVSKHPQYFL